MARQNKDLSKVFTNTSAKKKEVGPFEDPENEKMPAKTVEQVKSDLLDMYEEKSKKQTVEDTHQRTTFLFRKDLHKRLDDLSKGKRGFKTMFLNKAIEALLNEMEK